MSKQYSAIVHSLTPFNEKFELDENALRLHLRRLREAGLSVYLGAAGAAEGYTLTREERNRVLAIGVEDAMFTLAMGGNGYQGMEGNIVPRLAAAVVSCFVANDLRGMHESFGKLMRLRAIMRGPVRSNQRGAKALLNAYGLPGGYVRPPRLPVSAAELAEVAKAVEALQIPEMAGWRLQR